MPTIDSLLYDPCESILQSARVIINDCQLSIDGNLLADSQPWTFPMMALAFRKLCDRLENNNVENFPNENFLLNLTPVPSAGGLNTDPAVQTFVNSEGYFDGLNRVPNPVLPADMLIPLKLWERPYGQTNMSYQPMYPANGGLPTYPRTNFLRWWEWRDDQIYFCGANQAVDVRVRYRRTFPDPVDGSSLIPIIRCEVAMAYLTAEIFADARGGEVSEKFAAEKEQAIKNIINRTTHKKQYQDFRRQPYSGRGRGSSGWRY